MKPQNFEERLIWYSTISIYGIYLLGLTYPFFSTLGWILLFYLCKRLSTQTENTSVDKKIQIPWSVWLWVICMLVMAIATVIGCIDNNLDLRSIIRALLNWTRDWALLAIFPLIGCLNIRPSLIYRLICIVSLQSLIIIPICYLTYLLHIPPLLYTSPFERLTQNGPIFYDVQFYSGQYEDAELRLFLFAPWGPALGLIGNTYFFLALQETNKTWRFLGIAGSIAMCIVSVSRLAIISLPIVVIAVWCLTNFTRPYVQIIIGFISFIFGIFNTTILTATQDFKEAFHGLRQSSSRAHEALARVAFERWKETPIWGHGIQEPGPIALGSMPIGSHHTWFGLLFVKGLVGFVALLVPILWSLIDLLIKAQKRATARTALQFLLTLLLFTFNDTQEVLSYLYWPGLVIMGIAFKEES